MRKHNYLKKKTPGRFRQFLKRHQNILKKTLFTLMILAVYRLGSSIMIGSVNTSAMKQLPALTFFSLLSGANFQSFTLFALGLSPFITSSIIFELLSNDIVPYLTRIRSENETKKRNQFNNILGIIFAVIQATSMTVAMNKQSKILINSSIYSYIYTVLMLVAGSMILLWLSKQIDSFGFGNGASLIIAAGIINNLPSTIDSVYNSIVKYKDPMTFVSFGLLMIAYIISIFFIVFIEKSERRLPIHFAKSVTANEAQDYMPIRVNPSNVIPVIFASSILQFPSMICSLLGKSPSWLKQIALDKPIGIIIYAVMTIFFTFYYSYSVINAKLVADNFKKSGCSIDGITPGAETEYYLNNTVTKLCVFGAPALLIIALCPIILPKIWNAASVGLTVGGTSLIIAVGVAVELGSAIETEIIRDRNLNGSMFASLDGTYLKNDKNEKQKKHLFGKKHAKKNTEGKETGVNG